eukprot:Opistho-2@12517
MATDAPCVRRTGFVWSERYMWHDTGTAMGLIPAGIREGHGLYCQPYRHFENAETKRRFYSLIDVCGLLDKTIPVKARLADVSEVARYHTNLYIENVKQLSDGAGGDAGECAPVGAGSFEIALLAVGGAIEATDAVIRGDISNAYVLCRPPGHHAESNIGRGFCLFNNIALAALHAIESRGINRVAIIDWDVHHGNGTEKAFYDRDDVLFVSLHQDNLFPMNSGQIECVGEGAGANFNINVPLPPGSGIAVYKAAFERVVLRAVRSFNPELVLVSCGFDAAAYDPLSHQMLPSDSFGWMAESLLTLTEAMPACSGRVVLLHEGGYSAEYSPFCGVRVIEALTGTKTNVVDPFQLEIEAYAYQNDILPHQELVIHKAETIVGKMEAFIADGCGVHSA